MNETVSLTDVSYVLLRNRRLIVLSTLVAILISIVVSFALPSWYRAKATILPPETATSQTDIVGIMRYAGYQPAMLPTLTSPSELYAAILRSRRVADGVIDSLDLVGEYGNEKRIKALDRLKKHTDISVTLEGLVLVEHEDRDRFRAAEVTNAFVRELDRFNLETNVTTARKVREFIETRLVQSLKELETAETALKKFKEATGVVLISEQTKASIQTAADLYGKIAELEVSLERMYQFATERSPEIMDIRAQIRALERKLAEMGYMKSDAGITSDSRLLPKFSNAPELEQRLAELMRDVEIKRSVYAVLSGQYEEAKIQEMKDTPTLQVLDWAHPPDVRSRPKRKVIVAISAGLAFFVSSLWVYRRDSARGTGLPVTHSTRADIADMLRDDLRQVGTLFRHTKKGTAPFSRK
jgi:tyrosine-protein kinase Etk/Wzc